MDKTRLRRKLQDILLAIKPDQRTDRSIKACENLLSTREFQDAEVIMIFLSLAQEVDTTVAIKEAWHLEKTIVVPRVSWNPRCMIPVEIHSLEKGLHTEPSGLKTPDSDVPVPIENIDLIITPGLGFDRTGNRLGRGGAFYDRFFAIENLRAIKCGFGFAEQVIESVPVTDHDRKVDFLVTDEGILRTDCRKGV
jgi:5-formyltetrahydrofolate cyclo-ligase